MSPISNIADVIGLLDDMCDCSRYATCRWCDSSGIVGDLQKEKEELEVECASLKAEAE